MDNLSTLHNYNAPASSSGALPSHRIARPSNSMFDEGFSESRLAQPATSSEMVALAPCVGLSPEDVLILVVLDGRTKISDTLYGEPGSGCPLVPSDKARMEAALAAMPVRPDDRPESSAVRDLHLFEGARRARGGGCGGCGCILPPRPPSLPHLPLPRPLAGEYNALVRPGETFPVRANVAFAIKERNGGKLNSHVWAFRGLLPILDPKYVILLDAGTVPAPTALLRLYSDSKLGGGLLPLLLSSCLSHSQRSFPSRAQWSSTRTSAGAAARSRSTARSSRSQTRSSWRRCVRPAAAPRGGRQLLVITASCPALHAPQHFEYTMAK